MKAAGKGILKVMSKMGISTVASYTGAQIFEAVGLQQSLVDEYFTGTASRIEGIDLDVIATEVAARHRIAYPDRPEELAHRELPVGGEYQWRREGRVPPLQPRHRLQAAALDARRAATTSSRSTRSSSTTRRSGSRRCAGCSSSKTGARAPVPIDEVEPVAEIVKRFSTGAMSYGSI